MTKISPKLFFLIFLSFFLSCKKGKDTPVNQPPAADAGSLSNVTLPADNVTLNGSGTDADGKIVAYLWSQVSGPNTATIANPGSSSTPVNGFMEGIYLFQLMVTDDQGATGVDTVSVIVNPSAVDTLILAPGNNPDEFQVTFFQNGIDATGTGFTDIPLFTWTVQSVPVTIREIIKFDLGSIPSSATVESATLSLYSDPAPHNGNFIDANFGADNSFVLKQITSSWSPATLSWSNQPATTINNQVVVPSTTNSFLDLNTDVTNMVSSMVKSNTNYGFFLELQNEVIYTSRVFCSSYNSDATKHPKLVIVYRKK